YSRHALSQFFYTELFPMADNNAIEIVSKSDSDVTSVAPGQEIVLTESSVVKLPFGPEEIASATQQGNSLVVTLRSGEQVVIGNFFSLEEGVNDNQLVLEDSNGVLWLGQYEQPWTDNSEFAFAEISELSDG